MVVWLNQLDGCVLAADVLSNCLAAFVVQDVELGLVLMHCEEPVDFCECLHHALICPVSHWPHNDGIC